MKCHLGVGEVMSLQTECCVDTITVAEGRVWITSGDTRDYCLDAGARLTLSSARTIIIEALQPSSFAVIPKESRGVLRLRAIQIVTAVTY